MYTRQGNSKQRLGSFEGEDIVSGFFKQGRRGHGGRRSRTVEDMPQELTRLEDKKSELEQLRVKILKDQASGAISQAQVEKIEERLNRKLSRLTKRADALRQKMGLTGMAGFLNGLNGFFFGDEVAAPAAAPGPDCNALGTALNAKMAAYATAMSNPATIANGAAIMAEADTIKAQLLEKCSVPLWKRPVVLAGVVLAGAGVVAAIIAVLVLRR